MEFKSTFVVPDGKERISVLVDQADDRGYGIAEAEIERSQRHKHPQKMVEIYVLIEGKLRVHLGSGTRDLMFPGDSVTIPFHLPHWAEQIGSTVSRIIVITVPAWTQENHVITP